ncbi:hypothetical protein NELLIE_45 [Arthrobacter phage Nellie]|uniref:Uncharacterized protein n=5 Tax=Jasminevirus TaxID=2560153 RepID=A0A0U4JBM1_9CAUD|nr:hypothetical protein FDG92_gp46 [Arthrobacter phage Jasmine]YP_009613269.1 hypothetical protein FDI47_gp45 [Arthrobacter phage Adat]ASZ73198.1 hypothetical protein GURGLEFERB_45 [Arthrobacter phage GurgleFerb]ASZ73763.1 hypothetical protein NELLIE_45 [Arthrobacter phage Nellie]AXH43733.1 hypothetical protein SEA_BRAD_45 [Arthrobacter phage Brad]ALY09317.1 hypothetical protein JASMINE_47 [Arthrobacter phage Jasmine]ASZ72628.1 hypothetical protein ADAT_45 [Arthrobacter phage Adat]
MCDKCEATDAKSEALLKEFFEKNGLKENSILNSDVTTTTVEVPGGIWLIQKNTNTTQVGIEGAHEIQDFISAVFIHDDMALDISLALAMTQPPEAFMAKLFGMSED